MSLFEAYEAHDALALAERVAGGDVSPSELLDTALDRLARHNPKLNAVVIPMEAEARAAIAAGLPPGPLRGVPFLLKDLHALYAGVRTTHGARLFRDFVPDHDSEMVARYRRAGLVVFGKTASPELGLSTATESTLFGVTRNPWDLELVPGGSSGGSAAAVAAGIVPAANASDGGGSIRIPASCCGLFGLKPTRARNPAGPDVGEGWSGMSSIHAITRSVRDSAALLDATAGPAPGDPYWAPPPRRAFLDEVGADSGRLRVALVTRTFNDAPTHPDCVAAAEDAAKLLESLGHVVEPASVPVETRTLGDATRLIAGASARAVLEDRAAALGRELSQDDVERSTFLLLAATRRRTAADYVRALRAIHAAGRALGGFFEKHDVLLTPTMATPPLRLGALAPQGDDLETYAHNLSLTIGFTQLMNATGCPAMSVPLHWNAEGLPIGTQLAARFGDEATLLRLAGQLEAARPWGDRRPPAFAAAG